MRLRDQPVTPKPRITVSVSGLLWVERLTRAGVNQAALADNITEAIDIALGWVEGDRK